MIEGQNKTNIIKNPEENKMANTLIRWDPFSDAVSLRDAMDPKLR